VLDNRAVIVYNGNMATIKIRPLAPAEQRALEKAADVVKDLIYLYKVNRGDGSSPTVRETEKGLNDKVFELSVMLASLPSLKGAAPTEPQRYPERKPLFAEHEKMRLGPSYTDHDRERILALTRSFVEGRVASGELNPENEYALKKAVKQAAFEAQQVYNAALEYMSG
jgi:hypothetical protein